MYGRKRHIITIIDKPEMIISSNHQTTKFASGSLDTQIFKRRGTNSMQQQVVAAHGTQLLNTATYLLAEFFRGGGICIDYFHDCKSNDYFRDRNLFLNTSLAKNHFNEFF